MQQSVPDVDSTLTQPQGTATSGSAGESVETKALQKRTNMAGVKEGKQINDKKNPDKIKQENQRGEKFNDGERFERRMKQNQEQRGPRGGRSFQRDRGHHAIHGHGHGHGHGPGSRGGAGGGGVGVPAGGQGQQHNQMLPQGGDGGFQMPDSENREEKKFTGRCRLFVGNLPNECGEEEFKKLFEPFGEFSEVYVNTQRGFGFIRMVC